MFIKEIDLSSPFGSGLGSNLKVSALSNHSLLTTTLNALVVVVALLGHPWILHDSYALDVLLDF